MKILITGASGMLGTAMEGVCKEQRLNYLGLSHEDLEITDKNGLEQKIEEYMPSIIINSAAFMGIPACEENPKKAFEINAISALNLAKICKNKGINLVQISSNAIFDGKKGGLYFETDTPNPQNIYGLSKYAGEICAQNNLDSYYIMRFPKLFGSRRNNTLGFTDKMIDKMRKGEELKIADDRIDTFTYTIHAARKIISLLQDNAQFGIYHIANQGSVSYYDFVCKFAEKIGYAGKIMRSKDSDFPAPAPNPLRVELGSNKIKDMPNWENALDEYVKTEKIKL
jgi:dTDP-4-dehydrorhamnose reductase